MKRRTALALLVPASIGISGCSSPADDSTEEPSVTVSVEARRCDDAEGEVNGRRDADGSIEFFGVVQNVAADRTLDASLYRNLSDERQSLICSLVATQTDAGERGDCSGSVEYSGSITLEDRSVERIVFLREVDGSQSLLGSLEL